MFWFQFGSNLVPIWFQFGSNTFLHVTVTERSKDMEGVAFSRDEAQDLAPKFTETPWVQVATLAHAIANLETKAW
jgi:hypothetical protein